MAMTKSLKSFLEFYSEILDCSFLINYKKFELSDKKLIALLPMFICVLNVAY